MYVKTDNPDIILNTDDNSLIPVNLKNVDYLKILAWVKTGNVISSSSPTTSNNAIMDILALEQKAIMPRITREFMLAAFEKQEDYLKNPNYIELKALDDKIAVLRKGV